MPRIRPEPALAALMALAALYGWALFVSTFVKPGSIGPNFNAPGTDWMVFHAAARATLDGHIAGIFDGDKFTAFLNAQYKNWLTSPLPFRPWVYPPGFLLLVLPFGAMGFFTAYLLFQFITAGALVGALRSRMHRDLKLAVLLTATILAAPHSGAYDALLLVIAGFLWIARTGNETWRWMIMLALWIVPIISPPAVNPPGRFIPFLLAALIAIILGEYASAARELPREVEA